MKIDINISNQCNMSCEHCDYYFYKNDEPFNREAILNYLAQYKDKLEMVRIGEAEPTYTKAHVEFIAELCDLGYPIAVNTNLTNSAVLQDKAVLDLLLKPQIIYTSYDPDIRFKDTIDLIVWVKYASYLCSERKKLHRSTDLNVCITKQWVSLSHKETKVNIQKIMEIATTIGFDIINFTVLQESVEWAKPLMVSAPEMVVFLEELSEYYKSNQPNINILTFYDIYTNEFMSCHYKSIDKRLDIDGSEHVGCYLKPGCVMNTECLLCKDYLDCGGRCVFIPCYYNKRLFDEIKEMVNEKGDS